MKFRFLPVAAIPAYAVIGRNTQGVKLINLEAGDKLQAIAPVISEEKEDAENGQTEGKR